MEAGTVEAMALGLALYMDMDMGMFMNLGLLDLVMEINMDGAMEREIVTDMGVNMAMDKANEWDSFEYDRGTVYGSGYGYGVGLEAGNENGHGDGNGYGFGQGNHWGSGKG